MYSHFLRLIVLQVMCLPHAASHVDVTCTTQILLSLYKYESKLRLFALACATIAYSVYCAILLCMVCERTGNSSIGAVAAVNGQVSSTVCCTEHRAEQ
jgi:hypothetical protein